VLVHGRAITTDVVVTEAAPGNLRVDPLRFDRVLDNLVTNAAKYTERGSITITLDGAPGLLVVRVADSGRGMSERLLRQLFFERELTTAKTSGSGGWGLGLAVVVRLLGELGGELHVESVEGRGSTFEVRLPVAPPTRSLAADDQSDHETAAGGPSEPDRGRAAASAIGADGKPTNEPFDATCRRVVRLRASAAATSDAG
jgi:K+-sensing histidine kinase KdpD